MKINSIYLILVAVLILLNVVLLIQNNLINKKISISEEYLALSKNTNIHEKQQFISYLSSSLKATGRTPDTLFTDLGENPIVIVYFKEGACYSCVVEIIGHLSILADKIGQDKIAIAGSFSSPESLLQYSEEVSSDNFKILYLPRDLNFEGIEQAFQGPAVFVFSNIAGIQFFFLPTYTPELVEPYFNEILPSKFSESNTNFK